jgi:hypothetical protein
LLNGIYIALAAGITLCICATISSKETFPFLIAINMESQASLAVIVSLSYVFITFVRKSTLVAISVRPPLTAI